MSKYRAVQSGRHASKREAVRAHELALLEKIGEISDLKEQVKYTLIPKQEGERAVTYTADFVYRDKGGAQVVEDVKSPATKTQQYVIRRKLMKFVHGVTIKEVM